MSLEINQPTDQCVMCAIVSARTRVLPVSVCNTAHCLNFIFPSSDTTHGHHAWCELCQTPGAVDAAGHWQQPPLCVWESKQRQWGVPAVGFVMIA